eukprot:5093086-Pleurochrysis_carterae.AAC.1
MGSWKVGVRVRVRVHAHRRAHWRGCVPQRTHRASACTWPCARARACACVKLGRACRLVVARRRSIGR